MVEERDILIGDNDVQEYEFRMNSMEKVMADLDEEGLFGDEEKKTYSSYS